MKKFKLVSTFDDKDSIEFEVEDGETPETVALDQLGWFLVAGEEEADQENS
jgi:hypothetical protein